MMIRALFDTTAQLFACYVPSARLADRWVALFATAVVLSGCGGGGSDVGDQPDIGPTAVASVVLPGNTVRSGAEVLLTGKDSVSGNDPIESFNWQQIEGEPVTLYDRGVTNSIFTAPREAGRLTFRLTVRDFGGRESSNDVSIVVERYADSDDFLRVPGVSNHFTVVAATREEIQPNPGASDIGFSITVTQIVSYEDRNGVPTVFRDEAEAQVKNGAWLASEGASFEGKRTAYNNPRFKFDIPPVSIVRINEPYQDAPPGSAERSKILDPHRIDEIDVSIEVALTLDPNAAATDVSPVIYVYGPAVEGGDLLASSLDAAMAAFDPVIALQAQASAVQVSAEVAWQSLLEASGQETALTAAQYYAEIDPDNARSTLSGWLKQNCMDPAVPDYGAQERAVYTNNFDLGFGRDMYVQPDCLGQGNLASVVINYPFLQAAALKSNPIIAVAMEYTAPPGGGEPFAKFYTFAPDGTGEFQRVLSADFDGRGEKYQPASCIICHGGSTDVSQSADRGSIFMPWDVKSLVFADEDPSVSPDATGDRVRDEFARAKMEPVLRRLNQIVRNSYGTDWPVAELVDGWYHGDLASGDFDPEFVPQGWQPSADPENPVPDDGPEIYLQVIAQNCRACHTHSSDSPASRPPLDNYRNFSAFNAAIVDTVFHTTTMPNARLTGDRFWVGNGSRSAGEILSEELGVDTIPGEPQACVSTFGGSVNCGADQSAANSSEFRLDGSQSTGVARYEWSIISQPAGSQAKLVGVNTAQPAIKFDQSGNYVVRLVVANDLGDEGEDEVTIMVGSNVPQRVEGKPEFVVGEGSSRPLSASFLEYVDPDTSAAELIYTVADDGGFEFAEGFPPTFTQADLDQCQVDASNCNLIFVHNGLESVEDVLVFSLSDGVNDPLTNQSLRIGITPANDAPVLESNNSLTVIEGGNAQIGPGNLFATDSDNSDAEIVYTVTTCPAYGSLNDCDCLAACTFTQADINNLTSPTYSHDGSENLADGFDFSLSDGLITIPDLRLQIEIQQVNDEPTLIANTGLSVMEDSGSNEIGITMLNIADADNIASEISYTVTASPSNGSLSRTSFTQQDINDGLLTYTPNSGYPDPSNESAPDEFSFSAQDPGGASIQGVFSILVQPENDAPTEMTNLALSGVNYQGVGVITDTHLKYDDSDTSDSNIQYTVTQQPTYGSLSLTSFSQSDINNGLLTYTYDQGFAAADNADSIMFSVVDDGGNQVPGSFRIEGLFVSFAQNVEPEFSKDLFPLNELDNSTCTDSGCHGPPPLNVPANTFDLSGNNASDYAEIVNEGRVDTDNPGNSLLIRAPLDPLAGGTGLHGGPVVFLNTDDPRYQLILRWIEEGAQNN